MQSVRSTAQTMSNRCDTASEQRGTRSAACGQRCGVGGDGGGGERHRARHQARHQGCRPACSSAALDAVQKLQDSSAAAASRRKPNAVAGRLRARTVISPGAPPRPCAAPAAQLAWHLRRAPSDCEMPDCEMLAGWLDSAPGGSAGGPPLAHQ